jgi:RecB family exonuclease
VAPAQVITPRRTRLVRVPHLQAFRHAIGILAEKAGNAESREPALWVLNPEPRTRSASLVVVPTRSAARQLTRGLPSIEAVTRDELYDRLHARLDQPPRRLTALERDVMAQAAARSAASRFEELTFQLRPGLVAEMLRFYDQLRRQSQQVNRFEELIDEALGPDDLDRAARRMRVQTTFLAAAFREYERLVAASSGCDEHTLRAQLIAEPARDPVRHVIVTVADWIAESEGLFLADFDLLARIPGLERLEIVATERVLASGFDERVHDWWPGLEELQGAAAGGFARPLLIVPASDAHPESSIPASPVTWWTHRDREEELVAVARQLKADEAAGEAVPLARTAVVFKRPLPYLYAAAEVFRSARIPFHACDALPLASEPAAAALDLVLDAVASNFTRSTLVALLRSPHFVFADGDAEITRESVSAFDRLLSGARYLGELDRLDAVRQLPALDSRFQAARPALEAALTVAREIAPLATPRPASQQLLLLLAFWSSHLRPIADADPFAGRERRARAAIENVLAALAAVHAAHDDPEWTVADAGVAVRRWIEEHTFAPEPDGDGVQLLDDHAARYGNFDDVTIVGLVDADWPEKPRRNIFYPPALLRSLGWPSEKDRRSAADARFLDLLSSASRRTTVSTCTLDDDALVPRSLQLDEIVRARLSSVTPVRAEIERVFDEEALSLDPPALDRLERAPDNVTEPGGRPAAADARSWAGLRIARSAADSPEFHGTVRTAPARTWAVSALETYLDCPFKFFAQHVLKLQEEPEDEEVMDPRRQGQFVHQVFETFFSEWQAAGHRAITERNLDLARDLFTAVVDRALERLPAAEAGLERTRLLGSPAAAGLGEAVFRMEAERPVAVVERLLENRLEGEFRFTTADGNRTIALKGKADRIDLLGDGTFRLIDYKLGWPPDRSRALQLPIYGVCAEQTLARYRGRSWRLAEAAYLAFKGPRRVVPLFAKSTDRERVLGEAQQRLADTIDAIARGEFPPTPDDVYRCDTCTFASVCRKDYVGDV